MKYFLLLLSFLGILNAQGVLISPQPAQQPNASAALEVRDTTAGFLPPRMSTAQRNAINAPAIGLTIYNLTTECLEVFHSTGWKTFSCKCSSNPTAGFTYSPQTVFISAQIQFQANTPGNSYVWSFSGANPSSGTSQNATTSWAQAGTYSVVLTETNSEGCSATDSTQVVVQNCVYQSGSQTFNFTGSQQSFTVPSCVTSLNIVCNGAAGGDGHTSQQPKGQGGVASGTLSVIPGQVIYIYVGGQGQRSNSSPMAGGWNGGGNGYNYGNTSWFCAGGGGASDVRVGGTALSDRVIVAGGGGGGGGSGSWGNGAGGNGGGLNGSPGYDNGAAGNGDRHGKGGTQTAGGAGATDTGGGAIGSSGTLGQGGNASTGNNTLASGGGGGYYGGGGGSYHGGGGGGGSSYIGGVSNGTTSSGGNSGNGSVVITW